MDNIQAFINQMQTSVFMKDAPTKKSLRIVVKHKTGVELIAEEEGRRKKIKSLQRKNKRNRRRNKCSK